MLPALIGAGASILGGILGRKKQKSADASNLAAVRETNAANRAIARETNEFNRQQIREQNAYNDPSKIRDRAEAAGFNPLAFVGPGVGQQSSISSGAMSLDQPGLISSNDYMGASIADAGLLLANALQEREEKAAVQRLQEQNKALQDKLNQATIRPKLAGVYAQREQVPTLRRAIAPGVPEDMRPMPDSLAVDPRREVEASPITSSSGVMVVDNPHLPFRLYSPTLDGDEPLQWYDYPSLIPPVVAGFGAYAYDKVKTRQWNPSPVDYVRKTRKRLKSEW